MHYVNAKWLTLNKHNAFTCTKEERLYTDNNIYEFSIALLFPSLHPLPSFLKLLAIYTIIMQNLFKQFRFLKRYMTKALSKFNYLLFSTQRVDYEDS